MVYLSQKFQNSQGKFHIGISRFKNLSSSTLASVKAIFTTTGHCFILFLQRANQEGDLKVSLQQQSGGQGGMDHREFSLPLSPCA